MVNEVSDKKPD